MTTPTPLKHTASQQGRTPSQQGAVATPPVSTPFSASHTAAFSPHRSSPQQFKKSPATSATLMGSINAPVNFDSPSAAAAMGALGISGGIDLGLEAAAVGGLGHLASLTLDDDERNKRLRDILHELQKHHGMVSEAGLERLAKKQGLECMWEEGMGGVKSRTLIVAGSALAIDVVFSNNIVLSVAVTFPESTNESVMKHVDKAGQILLNDLKLGPNEHPLTKTLDRFAENLEHLASLDRLSAIPTLNLHEAIAGIFESLDRLFQWDLAKLREDPVMSGEEEDYIARAVMATVHGRPLMHARGCLGLSLDYWKERAQWRPRSAESAALTEREQTWAIQIGCIPMGALVYQPVRVSDKWISDDIEKRLPTNDDLLLAPTGPILDWLDPPDVILPSSGGLRPEDVAGGLQGDASLATPKLPEVIFKAKLNPPVTVPFSVWHQIYDLVGMASGPEFAPATFDSRLFPIKKGTNHDPSEPRTIQSSKDVFVVQRDGSQDWRLHNNTLFIYKPVYGRTLEELPFGHPSQLVRMLPTLRQYALLATLLEGSFDTKLGDIFTSEKGGKDADTTAVKDEYSTLMAEGGGEESSIWNAVVKQRPEGDRPSPADAESMTEHTRKTLDDPVKVDVVLTAHPLPRLQVTFPLQPFREGTADIVVEIRLNAEVYVVSQNIWDETEDFSNISGKGKGVARDPQKLGRALAFTNDIGMWCQYILTRCL